MLSRSLGVMACALAAVLLWAAGRAAVPAAAEPAGVYLVDPATGDFAAFDFARRALGRRIPSKRPADEFRGIAVAPDGRRLYLSRLRGGSVSVIETATGKLVREIELPQREPGGLALSPDGATVYVAHYAAQAVTAVRVDGGRARTIALSGFPGDLAPTPDGSSLLVTNRDAGAVFAITLATGATEAIPVGRNPVGIAVSADGATAYVSHDNDSFVAVLALTPAGIAPRGRIETGLSGGAAVALSPDGRHVLVGHCCANSAVSVIAAATGALLCQPRLAPAGLDPARILFSPDAAHALITGAGTAAVTLLPLPCGAPVALHPFAPS